MALATFGTFVAASDERLTSDRAFVALSLITIIRLPLNVLPILITLVAKSCVSLKRLNAFLQLDELDPDNADAKEQAAVGMAEVV